MLAVAGNCIEICLTGMVQTPQLDVVKLMTRSCKQIFFQLKGVFVISGNLASDVRDVLACFRRNARVVLSATIPCESGARLTKAFDVTMQRYRTSRAKIDTSQMHVLLCMGSKFCVKFQRFSLKFHAKFWSHTSQGGKNLWGGKNLTTYDIYTHIYIYICVYIYTHVSLIKSVFYWSWRRLDLCSRFMYPFLGTYIGRGNHC